MRTALLAAIKRDDEGELRALLPLAGRSVLGWQIDYALMLGCERIACLCETVDANILALQRKTEQAGAEFHILRSNAQLVALLKQGDDIVMVQDGMVVDPAEPTPIKQERGKLKHMVLTMASDAPAAQEWPEEFERVDARRSWAGLAVLGAQTVHKLADYPADTIAMSLLMRLALQDGVQCQSMVPANDADLSQVLATSHKALSAKQNSMMARALVPMDWATPFVSLCNHAAKWSVLNEWRLAPWTIVLIASVLVGCGAVLMAFGLGGAGLIALTLTGLVCQYAASASELAVRLYPRSKPDWPSIYMLPVLDISAIAGLMAALTPSQPSVELLALPIFAIGLARIAAQQKEAPLASFWIDRTLHLLLFAMATIAGVLAPALALFGLAALGHKLLQSLSK